MQQVVFFFAADALEVHCHLPIWCEEDIKGNSLIKYYLPSNSSQNTKIINIIEKYKMKISLLKKKIFSLLLLKGKTTWEFFV